MILTGTLSGFAFCHSSFVTQSWLVYSLMKMRQMNIWAESFFKKPVDVCIRCAYYVTQRGKNGLPQDFEKCQVLIKSYNPEQKPSFFIARVGSHAGKPTMTPYTANNSFAVFSDDVEADFQRVKLAYDLGMMRDITYGSCQPFIRLRELRQVVESIPTVDDKIISALKAIEEREKALKEEAEKLKTLRASLQFIALKK